MIRILPSWSTCYPLANSLPCWFMWQNPSSGIHDSSDVRSETGLGGAAPPSPSFLLFWLPTWALPVRKPSAKALMDLVSDRSSFRTSTWEFFVSARISLAADSPLSTSRQAMYTRAPGAKKKRAMCSDRRPRKSLVSELRTGIQSVLQPPLKQ